MRLLLDSHVSPEVARQLLDRCIDAVALPNWLDGTYRSAPDDAVLTAARADGRTLVTYDLLTIPPLLKEWTESGRHHAGVILVDERSLRQSDIGGQLRALLALAVRSGEEPWEDRVVFLTKRERNA